MAVNRIGNTQGIGWFASYFLVAWFRIPGRVSGQSVNRMDEAHGTCGACLNTHKISQGNRMCCLSFLELINGTNQKTQQEMLAINRAEMRWNKQRVGRVSSMSQPTNNPALLFSKSSLRRSNQDPLWKNKTKWSDLRRRGKILQMMTPK